MLPPVPKQGAGAIALNTIDRASPTLQPVPASTPPSAAGLGRSAYTAANNSPAGTMQLRGQTTATELLPAGEAAQSQGFASTAAAAAVNRAVGSGDTSTLSDPQATIAPFEGTTWQPSANFQLFPGGQPQASDIKQNSMNDCYLDSTLASLAETNPQLITNAVTPNASAKGAYDVKMYDPNGKQVTVSVNSDELVGTGGAASIASVTGADGKSNWGLIMEKAFAKYNDVYGTVTSGSGTGMEGIGNEGRADAAMAALTGPNEQTTDLSQVAGSTATALAAQMNRQIGSGVPVVATTGTTGSTLANGDTISASHVYTVSNVYKDSAGNYRVQIRNPWGASATGSAASAGNTASNSANNGYEDMSLADFTSKFGWVTAGDSSNVNNTPVNINTRVNLYEAQNVAKNSDPSSYLAGSAGQNQFVVGKDSYGHAQVQVFRAPSSDDGKGSFVGGTVLQPNTSYNIDGTWVNVDADGKPSQGGSATEATQQAWSDNTVSFG